MSETDALMDKLLREYFKRKGGCNACTYLP
jgi:hypothetical protein